jgi:hypothetical protein
LNRPYVDTLSEATRLKLRAANILLGNAEEAAYQAAVVYHEAYRAEARALRALDGPSRETALRSLVEQCGCLVDGLDPSGAHSLWGRILNEEQRLPRRAYNALTSYLRDRSVQFNDRLDAILAKGPAEMRDDPFLFGITIARDEAMRRRATAFFTQVVAAFPGDAQFWMLRALVAAEAGEAWKSIRRSRALMPDMPAYEMVALLIVLGQTGRREYVKSAFEKLSSEAQPEAAVATASPSRRASSRWMTVTTPSGGSRVTHRFSVSGLYRRRSWRRACSASSRFWPQRSSPDVNRRPSSHRAQVSPFRSARETP